MGEVLTETVEGTGETLAQEVLPRVIELPSNIVLGEE